MNIYLFLVSRLGDLISLARGYTERVPLAGEVWIKPEREPLASAFIFVKNNIITVYLDDLI
jgi:hypothetical protein